MLNPVRVTRPAELCVSSPRARFKRRVVLRSDVFFEFFQRKVPQAQRRMLARSLPGYVRARPTRDQAIAAATRAADSWRDIRISELECRQCERLQAQLIDRAKQESAPIVGFHERVTKFTAKSGLDPSSKFRSHFLDPER